MNRTCRLCQTGFDITDDDLAFYNKVSPVFGGKKYLIPPPTLCPDCRQQRRQSFKNERYIYDRTCDLCRQSFISIFSPDKKDTVYCHDCWWGDSLHAGQYGRSIDFSRSFMRQFHELKQVVPQLGIINTRPENSDYCNATTALKNCYLSFNAMTSEDCYYCKGLSRCMNDMDCLRIYDCELCYQCIDCHQCYNSHYVQNCTACRDSLLCFDCVGCSDCIGCMGLRNKQYHIFNQPYSKEDYQKKAQEYYEKPMEELWKLYQEQKLSHPHRATIQLQCEQCVGDSIYHSKNAHFCFDVVDSDNIKYSYDLREKNYMVYDIASFGNNMEFCYEANSSGSNIQRSHFTDYCWNGVNDVLYSSFCGTNSHHCFGCVGLKNASYCILNKQYSKEEYEELVPKIIERMIADGEWGEFFPASLSPFGYNETVASEYYPLTREQALSFPSLEGRGQGESDAIASSSSKGGKTTLVQGNTFNWSDFEPPKPEVKKIIPASKLPDNIKEIPDDILNWAIECEVTQKPFRIIKQELQFYREHHLPIPRRHPDQRHKDRMALRNPRKLWDRNCIKCNSPIQTTYAPDRKEIVHCEACYLSEVY